MRRIVCFLCLFLLLLCFSPISVTEAATQATQVQNVKSHVHIDAATGAAKLRLVLDLNGPLTVPEAAVSATPLPNLTLALPGVKLGKGVKASYQLDGKIANTAVFKRSGSDLALTVNLPGVVQAGDYKVFTLPADDKAGRPFRIVLDIQSSSAPLTKLKFSAGLKGKVITLDPGHGGSDSGALGPSGLKEKDVTLAIAMRTKALLEKSGAKVVMTRVTDKDVFGPNASNVEELSARTAVANNARADAFVSIHNDSFSSPTASGTSSFYYEKTKYDGLLSDCLQEQLLNAGGRNDRGSNTANFYVIKRTVMPATLVELAFISNPEEERLLASPTFQQKMANAIVMGLDSFFRKAAASGGSQ
ncbi:N-acetylmuramoyl-L-alanine amidase family protein [Anaeromusa acidaminophila]|uniref:N-acetylmuramoyl-L-alanine amidase family protein n=1 Tax=Anaeromusa acidaminophila TaxID=81464 RepID=UPI00036C87D8|nr:N-acetylmuramoyl-L-alanine amidase [Anaeromusa acidaminophila]